MSWPWSVLGLDGPCEAGEVKRAYAEKVKTAHPEEDPEGFQQLHAAYQAARRLAAGQQALRMAPELAEPSAEPDGGGFDYDALFAGTDEGPPPPKEGPEPENESFDYDGLLTEESAGAETASPPPKAAGPQAEEWDYERLFAEGDEERRQARRRRAEERLREARERRKAQEKTRRDRALESEEAWSAAYAALHALEVLWSAGASTEDWSAFLHSGTFLNAQHNMDFIFGLEDFLEEHPWLPDEIKRHIYLVYQFYNGRPDAMYLGLYRLVKDSGEKKQNGRRTKPPWHKRVFRQERGPLLLLWVLLSVLFIDYFFLSGSSPLKKEGPEPGAISVEQREETAVPPASDSPQAPEETVDIGSGETWEGIEAARDLAVSLGADDYPGPYAVTAAGITENGDGSEQYYWAQCTGQDAAGETLVMNYFLSMDGTKVCCVSDEDNTGSVYLELAGTAPAGGRTVSVYRCPE